jgi:hypothetical protein
MIFAVLTAPTFKLHRRLFGQSMTTRYLSQMTPRLSRSAKELLLLWDAKRLYLENSGKAWSKAFEAHLDLTYFTTVWIVSITYVYGLIKVLYILGCHR